MTTEYVVIENTPGYLPENTDPLSGTWEECCASMDAQIRELVALDGWTVALNEGCGFRLPGGTRRTYLSPPDAHEHSLHRVIEVCELLD